MRYLITFVFYSITVLPNIALAQTCITDKSRPDSRYTTSNETVTDVATGLMWHRCVIGQAWQNGQCIGDYENFTWQQALQAGETNNLAGYTDWRLPNIKELNSLIDRSCTDPAYNIRAFDLNGGHGLHSSTFERFGYVMTMDMNSGFVTAANADFATKILLVRDTNK